MKLRAALVLFLVFSLGVGVGGLGMRVLVQRRMAALVTGDPVRAKNEVVLAWLDQSVGLDAAQRAQVERLLEAQGERQRAALEPARPQLQRIRAETIREVRALLRPDQRHTFDARVSELESRRRESP